MDCRLSTSRRRWPRPRPRPRRTRTSCCVPRRWLPRWHSCLRSLTSRCGDRRASCSPSCVPTLPPRELSLTGSRRPMSSLGCWFRREATQFGSAALGSIGSGPRRLSQLGSVLESIWVAHAGAHSIGPWVSAGGLVDPLGLARRACALGTSGYAIACYPSPLMLAKYRIAIFHLRSPSALPHRMPPFIGADVSVPLNQ